MSAQPLEGVRVIDMGQVLATPFATYLLNLLGAEVIKIEPPQGDWIRSGRLYSFATQNGGKESIVVNMRAPGADEVVLRLIEQADVFTDGFAPGVAEAMGLGWEIVKTRNPKIVYSSLSAFGADGPFGGRAGFDHVVQAVSGIMMSTGFPDGPPTKVGAPYLDFGGGLLLAFGLLAGIMEQRRTGEAVRVDATMLDAGLLFNAGALVATQDTGQSPPRAGNQTFAGTVASGAFETTDGLLMLAANKERHQRLVEELLDLEPLDTLSREDGRDRLAAGFATNTADFWEQKLTALGVPAARVRSLHDVTESGYPTERGLLTPIPVAERDEPLLVPSLGVRLNGEMPGPRSSLPVLGQHTNEVLRRMGFSEGELEELTRQGVIGTGDEPVVTRP